MPWTSVIEELTGSMDSLIFYVEQFATLLGTILVSVGVIWTIGLCWRKYKESCDKV